MAVKLLCLALFFYIVTISTADLKRHTLRRQKDFSRIRKHELIYVDSTALESKNLIEFDAFNQHYTIQLALAENLSPMVRFGEGEEYRSENTCHHRGKVLNAPKSVVALSTCEGAGIRGMVRAFGDTLYIHHELYFMDPPTQFDNSYHLNDRHLVYRVSDYDFEAAAKDWGPLLLDDESDELFPKHMQTNPAVHSLMHSIANDNKRRLYNGGKNVIELYTFAAKSFYDEIGSNSERELRGFINAASAEYENHDWGSTIGNIELSWTKLDIMTSTSGRFKGMRYSGSFDGRDGGSGYRRQFAAWGQENGDDSDYDVAALYTRDDDIGGGGSAWKSSCCSDSRKYMFIGSDGNDSRQRKVLAHEIGHTLGMEHDEKTGGDYYTCPDRHIMGDGDYNKGWSSCSEKYLKDWFDEEDGASCLRDRGRGLDKDGGGGGDDGGGGGNNDDDDNNYGGGGGGSGRGRCVHVSGLSSSFNGEWAESGSYNGRTAYRKGSKYLFAASEDGDKYWTIYSRTTNSVDWEAGWCDRTDIEDCEDDWETYDGGRDKSCEFVKTSCGGMIAKDLSCLEDYDTTMCLSPGDAEEDGSRSFVFEVDVEEGQGCYHDEPVWVDRTSRNDTKYILHKGENGEWIVNEGAISEYGVLTCDEANLLDCVAGEWYEYVMESDYEERRVDGRLGIESCGSGSANTRKDFTVTILIVVLVVIGIGLGAFIVCGGYKRMRASSKAIKHLELAEEEEEEEEEAEEQEESEKEIEVETQTIN